MTESSQRRKIVIAGGSGFLGTSLTHHLKEFGTDVVVLSRSEPSISGIAKHVAWDGRTLTGWEHELDGADALINLTGRSVDCIKTPDHQDEILRSRVESTLILGRAMRGVAQPPPVWIQMSSAHIYGDPPNLVCDEDSPTGYGLAPFVATAWEEAFRKSLIVTQRGVILRTSFVLGRDQGAGVGALTRLGRLAKWGLGGTVGSGSQGISWIHEIDLNRLIEQSLTDETMEGVYIASAPNPVSNRQFMRALRTAVRMPIGLPVSQWMVKFGARTLLQTDPELALCGRYVVSRRLAELGFEFQFPLIESALAGIYRH